MKLIGYLQAWAASRQVIEEYAPSKLPYPGELVDAIRERYGFQSFPNVAPGAPPNTTMVFAGGRYDAGDDAFGIGTLIMEATGDVVQTVTTDQAERVLEDLASFLSERFGFRLNEWPQRRSYTSNLVMEFDDVVENYIGKLADVAAALNRVKQSPTEVSLKRIAFGGTPAQIVDHVSDVEQADFLIERRVSNPMEPRRYYCSAPIKTEDHLRLMEEIEHILKG
jgi:hypothetical protein